MIVQQTHNIYFTNYVDQYTNISGSFEQAAKRENAITDKTAYKMEVTLGNDAYSEENRRLW